MRRRICDELYLLYGLNLLYVIGRTEAEEEEEEKEEDKEEEEEEKG